jgi:serine/threonine protein kinase
VSRLRFARAKGRSLLARVSKSARVFPPLLPSSTAAPARLAVRPPAAASARRPASSCRMCLLFIAAAATSLAAASGAALRDGRALHVGRALKDSTWCGIAIPVLDDSDFEQTLESMSDASREQKMLGSGGFGAVFEMSLTKPDGRSAFVQEILAKSSPPNAVAVKVPLSKLSPQGQTADATRKQMEEKAKAAVLATWEAILGELVCSSKASCPADSPFPAFFGFYKPGNIDSLADRLVYEKASGTPLSFAIKSVDRFDGKENGVAYKSAKTSWEAFVSAFGVAPQGSAVTLKNLDAALVAVRQLALAVSRLQDLGITHNDIKPGNAMVSGAGVKLLDLGLACLGPHYNEDDLRTASGTSFSSADKNACPRLDCMVNSCSGTAGFISAPKKLQALCKTGEACTAEKFRSVDLFSIGVVLMQFLTGNGGGTWSRDDRFSNLAKNTWGCQNIIIPPGEKNSDAEKLKEEGKYSNWMLSYYIALEGTADTSSDAVSTSRKRLFSFLAKLADGNSKNRKCFFCGDAAPIRYFLTPDSVEKATKFFIPRCYKHTGELVTLPVAMDALRDGASDDEKKIIQSNFFMKIVSFEYDDISLTNAPKKWVQGDKKNDDFYLLDLPQNNPALVALLDLLRKLLAWKHENGFSDAVDVALAIDDIRRMLHIGDATALARLPAPPKAEVCLPLANLARKQIDQRDRSKGNKQNPTEAKPNFPIDADVDAAFKACKKAAYTKAKTVSYHSSAVFSGPITGAFESLPFRATRGVWRKRQFTLECDVVVKRFAANNEAGGTGVWVEWSKEGKYKRAGYIQAAFDQSNAAKPYKCATRNMFAVKGSKCKALDLRYATRVRKRKSGKGLLKLFPTNAIARSLVDDIDSFATQCGNTAAADFVQYLKDAVHKRNAAVSRKSAPLSTTSPRVSNKSK